MRWVSYAFGGLSAAGAAGYLGIYLHRWEWQRALIAGILLLVVEVFLVCTVLIGRMARMESRIVARLEARADAYTGPRPVPDRRRRGRAGALDPRTEDVRRRLAEGREQAAGLSRFRWLEQDADGAANRTFVFVPVLLATGALLSAAAWVVQRVAAATARPADMRLAGRLAVLTAPPGGVREAPPTELGDVPLLPARSGGGRRRLWVVVAGVLLGGLALAGLVDELAEHTQTRPEAKPNAAATSVLLQVSVRGHINDEGRDLMAHQLWDQCRASTSVLLFNAPLTHVKGDVYAGLVRPALTGHDQMRLRGCLVDTQLDRVRFKIIGEGQVERLG